MKTKRFILVSFLLLLMAIIISAQQSDFPKLTGPYLGQMMPGMTPELFAPGIIAGIEEHQNCLTVSPEGKEIYWGRYYRGEKINKILVTKYENGRWTSPQLSVFSSSAADNDDAPFLSPDGRRLFFNSRRPIDEDDTTRNERIWVVEKSGSSWTEPRLVSKSLSRLRFHMQFSISKNGVLYFHSRNDGIQGSADIFCSRSIQDDYSTPENLGGSINTEYFEMTPFVAPDESYLLFARNRIPYGYGLADLYVSYRRSDGDWTEAVNLGETVNTKFNETCPIISPDGKYLFFNSDRNGKSDIYWMDAKIIEDLKPKALKLGAQDILRAIQKGDVETVKVILSENPNAAKIKDQWGRTPLHLAIDKNNIEIMESLIESGADVDATDIYAWTPLFRAIDKGKKEAAQLLISKGADVSYAMGDGFRAVHLASSVGNMELLELLLQRGADPNAKDRYDLTPLHIAAAYGFRGVVELLISYQADMNKKSIDGGSVFHFAQAGGHPDIAHLILSKGANAEPRKYPVFQGRYLGFKGQGSKAEIFLPEVLMHLNPPHNGLAISPDAKEIYWAETSINYDRYSRIWFMKEVDGLWTSPRIAPFSSRYLDNYPCFSVDGNRLFFSSNRPLDEKTGSKDSNIWYVERSDDGWSQPKSVGTSVNTDGDEATPTVDKDGTLYFSRAEIVEGKFDANIFRSRFINAQYGEPERLGETVNSSTPDVYPFIAPDGSYLIYCTGRYGVGFQLCISFLKKDRSWTEAKPIKGLLDPYISWCQGISTDGRYLFFAGHKKGVWDIYWVDAKIIEELRPKE